jgi:hypothetical protein
MVSQYEVLSICEKQWFVVIVPPIKKNPRWVRTAKPTAIQIEAEPCLDRRVGLSSLLGLHFISDEPHYSPSHASPSSYSNRIWKKHPRRSQFQTAETIWRKSFRLQGRRRGVSGYDFDHDGTQSALYRVCGWVPPGQVLVIAIYHSAHVASTRVDITLHRRINSATGEEPHGALNRSRSCMLWINTRIGTSQYRRIPPFIVQPQYRPENGGAAKTRLCDYVSNLWGTGRTCRVT